MKNREVLKKKLVEAERSYTEVQSTMENTNKQRKKDKAQIDKNEKELEDLNKMPEKNALEIKDCEHKLERLEKEKVSLNEELIKQLDELKEKSEPLTEKRLKFSDKLIGLKEAVNTAREELQVHESKMKILKQVETSEARKYESLKYSYEEAEKTLVANRTKLQELTELMPKMKEEMTVKAAEIDKLSKEERNLATKCSKLREEVRLQFLPLKAFFNLFHSADQRPNVQHAGAALQRQSPGLSDAHEGRRQNTRHTWTSG